ALARCLLSWPVAAFRHELIKFRLILRLAQSCHEVPEFPLLVLHALERLAAVAVECAVGTVRAPRGTAASALDFVQQIAATHASAPDHECKDHEPTGHHIMKPRIMRTIQAGLPISSSFATIGMTSSRLCVAQNAVRTVNVNPVHIARRGALFVNGGS